MAHVVVVGAGLAGLCAALALADFGHEVTVVEAAAGPGGQLSGRHISGHSTAADLGPAAFTLPAALRDLFRKTGRPLEKELTVEPVEPAVRLAFTSGERVDVPNATRAGAIRALDDALGAESGAQWDAVVQHGERTWQRLRPAVLGQAASSGPQRHGAAGATLRDVAARLLPDHRLAALLGTYATAVGEHPAAAPATLTVLPYLEQTFGLWTVDGGVHLLAGVLHRRATERKARFRFGARAESVAHSAGRAAGVRLAGGETLPADVVVWTAAPGLLPDDVVTARRSWWQRRGALTPGDSPGTAASVVTAVVDAQPPSGAPLRTVVVPVSGDPAGVLTVVAQPGAWVLHAPAPPAPSGLATGHLPAMFAAATSAGIDLGREPSAGLVRTPHDLERDLGVPGGRVYGTEASGPTARVTRGAPTALLRRPGPTTRLRGLFLAGAGAHPGPGVPLVAVSAAIVTDLVGRA